MVTYKTKESAYTRLKQIEREVIEIISTVKRLELEIKARKKESTDLINYISKQLENERPREE